MWFYLAAVCIFTIVQAVVAVQLVQHQIVPLFLIYGTVHIHQSQSERTHCLIANTESCSSSSTPAGGLRRPARYVIEGVHQDSSQAHWQFRLDVDEPRQSWTLDRSESPSVGYRDGRLRDEAYPNGSIEDTFDRSTTSAPLVRIALPELMLRWGRGPESFHPILVQHIGRRSILVTFEHREDPATRTTLVIDEHDGIARRSMEHGAATIVTSVRKGAADEVLRPPASNG